jgi:hypothetical protein
MLGSFLKIVNFTVSMQYFPTTQRLLSHWHRAVLDTLKSLVSAQTLDISNEMMVF